jgi:hypothetical protein
MSPAVSCSPLLGQQLLRRGLVWRYRELSGSMWPAVRPYDVVVVAPVAAAELVPGDIVALLRPEGLLVHRLRWRLGLPAGGWLVCQGDQRPQDDPPQPVERLLGRVIFVERQGRCVVPLGRTASRGLGLLLRGLRRLVRPRPARRTCWFRPGEKGVS